MRSAPVLLWLPFILLAVGCTDPTEEGDADVGPVPDTGPTDASTGDGSPPGDAPDAPDATGACTPGSCAELNVPGACTLWACNPVSGACEERNNKDYVPCTIDNLCFDVGFCEGGVCQVEPKLCSDGNPCTTDDCAATTGCTHTFNTEPCDDGNACTTDEVCAQGECLAIDTSGCSCTSDLDCAAFEDGNLCNGRVACIDDVCQVSPGSVVTCDTSANSDCFFTTCNPATGLCESVAPEGTPCSDSNGCTVGDTCSAGVCAPGESKCACAVDADCADFEDGNVCNGTLVCDAGLCQVSLASVVTCQTTPTAACEMAVCNADTGACEVMPRPEGASCDDNDSCTVATTCSADVCQGGVPLDCEDGNPCTDHACDPVDGCSTSLTACNDGDTCTTDSCDETVGCVTALLDCDDGNVCTTESCDPDGEGCVYEPVDCSDGNACTADLCDPVGGCYNLATACPDDGDPCTIPSCDEALGCVGTQIPCSDGNPCTLDSCDSATGACQFAPLDCTDDDPCTTETCSVAAGGCTDLGPPDCDDGDPCTDDVCVTGVGCAPTPKTCDDGLDCTADSCEAATGACINTGSACDCAVDGDCDDGNSCTVDTCDSGTLTCTFTPTNEGAPCDDGNACTDATVCTAGACLGTAVTCVDDGDTCTAESCDPGLGCISVSAVTCDDGDACTDDGCDPATGSCTTSATDCDDDDACTDDSCDSAVGCQSLPTDCDDGDACTDDTCDATTGCTSTPTSCDDGNACTDDGCDSATGCTTTGVVCDDGDACTTDSCSPVVGCGASPTVCDDEDPCTIDGCDSATGCTTQPACSDGVDCTADTCDSATGDCTFVPGPECGCSTAAECEDGNPCTTTDCDADTFQCTATVLAGQPCDDGDDVCTLNDTCDASGACVGTPATCPDDGLACTVESCFLPTVSATACDDLTVTWTVQDPAQYGSDQVCGFSSQGGIVGDYATAKSHCESFGARLCTAVELADREAYNTGGGFNGDLVWSVSSCGPGKRLLVDAGTSPQTACLDETTPSMAIRCCADVDPPAVQPGCHPVPEPDCGGTAACGSFCDVHTGDCQALLDCDDGNACTVDACDNGTCTNAFQPCADDGDACTQQTCDPLQGCTYPPKDCDDGDLCTTDTCVGGQCEHSSKCQDGTACTQDICDPATGACSYADACDDHYTCTVGTCVPLGTEASALSCEELGWSLLGTREVCLDRLAEDDCTQGTFGEAQVACEAVGARLCDAEEVASGAVLVDGSLCAAGGGTMAWTRNTCPGGHVAVDTARRYAAECRGAGVDLTSIVCCADAVPAAAGRCEQAPVADTPNCHGISDMSVRSGTDPCFVLAGGQLQCAGVHTALPIPQGSTVVHPRRFFAAGNWNDIEPQPVVQTDTENTRRCVVDAAGRVTCFGNPSFSAIDYIGPDESKTYDIGVPVLQVDVNRYNTCARPAQGLFCWGRNQFGQLGLGHQDDVATPTELPFFASMQVDQVAGLFSTHTCARAAGDVYCWGDGAFGGLGLGDTDIRLTPALVNLPDAAVDLAVYGAVTAAVLANGEIWVWGNTFGLTPAQLPFGGGDPFVKVDIDGPPGVGPAIAGLDSEGLLWTTGNDASFWPPGKTDPAAHNNATPRATELFRLDGTLLQTKAGGRIEDTNSVWPKPGNLGSSCDNDFRCWSHFCNAGTCDLPCSADDGFACTVTRAELTEVSASECSDLASFTFENGNTEVCGDSPQPCVNNVDQATAKASCQAMGGRLCRYEEVVAGAADGTGCGLNNDRIWTSTPCGNGHFMTLRGDGDVNQSPAPECTPTTAPDVDVRCCADADRARPRLCRHVPEWSGSQCCNAYDGSTDCD